MTKELMGSMNIDLAVDHKLYLYSDGTYTCSHWGDSAEPFSWKVEGDQWFYKTSLPNAEFTLDPNYREGILDIVNKYVAKQFETCVLEMESVDET